MKLMWFSLGALLAASRCLAAPTAAHLRFAEHTYAASCMFTAMRICATHWPIGLPGGPNNRYDCYDTNLALCELEAAEYKKGLSQK